MSQLLFGDLKSIAYKEAKAQESYGFYSEHECDCDKCEYNGYACPYGCETEEEPDYCENEIDLNQCVKCKRKSFRDWNAWKSNHDIIEEFEKNATN